jgi:protein-S-isoprenylcysteine O-methyltransferase Ste14
MASSEAVRDGQDIVFSPALAPLALLVVAVAGLLQWLLPLTVLSTLERLEDIDPLVPGVAGCMVAALGLSLSVAGYLSMKRHVGDIEPWRAASVLVTDGAYAWTRNPGYLGLWIALTGTGLAFALDWLLIVTVPVMILVSLLVVRREELLLEQRFARAYLDYKRRVPRYVFIR